MFIDFWLYCLWVASRNLTPGEHSRIHSPDLKPALVTDFTRDSIRLRNTQKRPHMDATILSNYNRILQAAEVESERLLPHDSSRSKAQAINAAISRLYLMTVQKYPTAGIPSRFTGLVKIDPKEASEIGLKTINAMLDARISEWEDEIPFTIEQGMELPGRSAGFSKQLSLRQALNIANGNLFNAFLYS